MIKLTLNKSMHRSDDEQVINKLQPKLRLKSHVKNLYMQKSFSKDLGFVANDSENIIFNALKFDTIAVHIVLCTFS